MAYRTIAALLPALLAAAPAHPQTPICPPEEVGSTCIRVLACVGRDRWFNGRAFGWGEGTVGGLLDNGVPCSGVWSSDVEEGFGRSTVTCEGGLEVTVLYTYLDGETGTTIGRGTTNDGRDVLSWSGTDVLQFLRGKSASGAAILPCEGGAVTLG